MFLIKRRILDLQSVYTEHFIVEVTLLVNRFWLHRELRGIHRSEVFVAGV